MSKRKSEGKLRKKERYEIKCDGVCEWNKERVSQWKRTMKKKEWVSDSKKRRKNNKKKKQRQKQKRERKKQRKNRGKWRKELRKKKKRKGMCRKNRSYKIRAAIKNRRK